MLHTTAGRVTDVRKLDERTLECQVEAGGERRKALAYIDPVSYTHLTLPTIDSVYVSLVARSFKHKHGYVGRN